MVYICAVQTCTHAAAAYIEMYRMYRGNAGFHKLFGEPVPLFPFKDKLNTKKNSWISGEHHGLQAR